MTRRAMTRMDLYAFMAQCRLGVLGTMSSENKPQSGLVGIAITKELEIVFDTMKHSRKYPNLLARPACCFVVGWTGEQTVQYEGEAEELTGPELKRYQQAYFDVWPDGQVRESWPDIAYFVVRPRWARYSDFAQDPPYVCEFDLTLA